MVSSPEAADDKSNLYSPEPFLFDIDFDPNLHNLNSPSTSDVIGKYTSGWNVWGELFLAGNQNNQVL